MKKATMDKGRVFVLTLSVAAIALLLTASLIAIFADQGGDAYSFTSLRAEEVQIYGGDGLYQYDNTYKAIIFRSFDWVNLVLVIPLFLLGLFMYRLGKLRGKLLLASLFTYLAYIYLIGVMGNAFNQLFLVWTALLSIGFFGLCITLADTDIASLPGKAGDKFPRKSVSVYIVSVGLILLLQYLAEIFSAYAAGAPPASLDHYTTLELAALELAIMIPLHIVGGFSLWRKQAWGYLIASILAFTSFMVFAALSVSLLLFYYLYGQGNVMDMAITLLIAIVATGFSLVIFLCFKD